MADPKYVGLPGIDSSEKDTYESADLPEDDQNWVLSDLNSESVEKDDIDTKQAFQKFNSKYLVGENADFSGKLGTKGGYDVTEYTLVGAGETETPTQKLQRLKIEVSELANHFKSDETSPSSTSDLISQVQILESRLSSIGDGKQLQGSFGNVMSSIDKASEAKPAATPVKAHDGIGDQTLDKIGVKASEMEARITKLEKALGMDTEALAVLTSQTKGKNLQEVTEGLAAKVSLLDPEKLPQIDSRLQAVLNKLNNINKAKKQDGAEQAATDKKVIEIFELMQKWDSVCASVPSIIYRLESLKELHQQAADFSSTVQHLEKTQDQISGKLSDTSDLAKQVDATLKQNALTIQKNLQSLEKRVQGLTSK